MIRKYHNHTLQTNPRHRGEEPHNNHKTPGIQRKASSFLFPIKVIAKLERTQSNAKPNRKNAEPHNGIKNESTKT